MSNITVYKDNEPDVILEQSADGARIANILDAVGVRFERWTANATLADDASQEDILAAYRESVDRLVAEYGFETVDVIHMKRNNPQKVAFRDKFLSEHTHSEDEVRFFVEGAGMFYLHMEGKVFATLCEKGDLISVPAGTKHWFDMGTQPEFTAIRFFNNPEGWVAHYTDDAIAESFPRMAFTPKAVLVDIEGTIGSISFVKDTLFPYAKEHLAGFIQAHKNDELVRAILDEVRAEAREPEASSAEVAQILSKWIDEDRKLTPLKELQGLIWEDGYRKGDFKAHLYADALDHLKKWRSEERELYVYSSGSVKAQDLFFEHSVFGDMRTLFSGFFDTKSGGPKKDVASYARIAEALELDAGDVLFLSDVVAELDAAREAGMSTALLERDVTVDDANHHDRFSDFSQIPMG